jgi:hypothetical protein
MQVGEALLGERSQKRGLEVQLGVSESASALQ